MMGFKNFSYLSTALIASVFAVGASGSAVAGSIEYSNIGHVNPATYVFTAAHTGDLSAYTYAQSSAGDTEVLELVINDHYASVIGLNNQTSTAGSKLDFGNVNAGDQLYFFIYDYTTRLRFFSDIPDNVDGAQHVYSTAFAGNSLIPAGTYVGFEDTIASQADFNYADLEFVFTNTATNGVDPSVPVVIPPPVVTLPVVTLPPIVTVATNVPEPATLLLLGAGLAGVTALRRRPV